MTEASGSSLDVILERDRIVEAQLSRREDERHVSRSQALEDRVHRVLSGAQFFEVPALELWPFPRVMVKPSSQFS